METLLRLVHIGDAVIWAGGALFSTMFLSPAATAAGPAAAPFMGALITKTRLTSVMTTASILTVGSGLGLWALVIGSSGPSGFRGGALTVGALGGLAALGVALGMQRPTIMKMKGLITEAAIAGEPPGDELADRMQVTRTRMVRSGNILSICVTVAIVGMALAG